MSKTETFASADMKGKREGERPQTAKKKTPTRDKVAANKSSKTKTTSAFFERMSKTETYATADMKGKIDKQTKRWN